MKRAFSLIELMIVIMIIGVVYTLAITKLKNYGETKMEPNFSNLKQYLINHLTNDSNKATLLCLDDCSECTIYVDEENVMTIKSFFDYSVELYSYDFLLGAVKVENDVYFDQENMQKDVCFSFSVSKNLVSDQIIVLYDGKAYSYLSYFDKVSVHNSLDDAIVEQENFARTIMQ